MRRQFVPAGATTPYLLDRLWFVGIHVVMFAVLMVTASQAHATSRIKDIAQFEDVRENTLVGYGLVTGLRNTGDDIKKIAPTKESLIGMLERLGINTRNDILDTSNVAAVMVTAPLPPHLFDAAQNAAHLARESCVFPRVVRSDALARLPSSRTSPLRSSFSSRVWVTCG